VTEKTQAIVKSTSKAISFAPQNLEQAISFSKLVATSDLVPKDYKGKPGNVLIAIQMGAEVGLAPMQALQSVAVINGRPSLWGDGALAVVQTHPDYEWHKEWVEGTGEKMVAVCQVKRNGSEVHETRFSVDDAKTAKLWGKRGYNGQDTPWITSPKRMLAMRARAFALRDKFSDALRGLAIAEEVQDYIPQTPRTINAAVAPANLSDLSPSEEPNRGHGEEGFSQAPPPASAEAPQSLPEPTVEPKQPETTPDAPQVNSATNPPERTYDSSVSQEKPEPKIRTFIVGKVEKKLRGPKPAYLIVEALDDTGNEWVLFYWHKTSQEELLKASGECEFAYAENHKDGKVFYSIEKIVRIGAQKFEDSKPF
jgi:hypothetical protein